MLVFEELVHRSQKVIEAFANNQSITEIRNLSDEFRQSRANVVKVDIEENLRENKHALTKIRTSLEVEKKAAIILENFILEIKKLISVNKTRHNISDDQDYIQKLSQTEGYNEIDLYLDTVIPPVWNFQKDLIILSYENKYLMKYFKKRSQTRFLILEETGISEDNTKKLKSKSVIDDLMEYRFDPPSRWILLGRQKKEEKAIYTLIKDTIDSMAIYQNTSNQYSGTWIQNEIGNINRIVQSQCVTCLKPLFRKKNILIISPGPSLEKDIKSILNYRDRYVILAPLQSYPALKENNIIADFLITVDPTDFSQKFSLEGINDCKGLICTEASHPNVMASSDSIYTIFTTKQSLDLLDIMNATILDLFGSSVSIIAVDLAAKFGAKSVTLLGQDLILGKNSYFGLPKTYNTTEVLDNSIKWNGTEMKPKKLLGKDGRLHVTRPDFYNFHFEFEFYAEYNMYETILYNATSIGADIKGFENIIFSDASSALEEIFFNDFFLPQVTNEEKKARVILVKSKIDGIVKKYKKLTRLTDENCLLIKERKGKYLAKISKNEKLILKIIEMDNLLNLYLKGYLELFRNRLHNLKSFDESLELTRDISKKINTVCKGLIKRFSSI